MQIARLRKSEDAELRIISKAVQQQGNGHDCGIWWFGQFGQMVQCSFKNKVVLGSSPVAVTSPSDFAPASSKFLDIQATIDCGFTLKRVRDMTRTYSQMK